jgi:hypothetical protein
VVAPAGDSVYFSGEKLTRHDGAALNDAPEASYDLGLFRDPWSFGRCGERLWLAGDGQFLVLDCGRVFRLDADAKADLRYLGSLDWVLGPGDVIYSTRLGRFVSFVGNYRTASGGVLGSYDLAVYEPLRLGLERRLSWGSAPDLPLFGPRYLFEAPSGRLLVVGSTGEANAYLVGLDL